MKVALVCVAKDEENYIKEWVDYHIKLGFDHIFIFENDWNCELDCDYITKQHYQGRGKQVEMYNTFIQQNTKYDWAAFLDIDEFLVLKKHKNVKNFISEYSEYNSIGINWCLFGNNNLNSVENNDYSVIKRFTKKQKTFDSHIKSIVNLSKKIGFSNPHHPNIEWVDTNFKINEGPFNVNGSIDVAQINHYFCKTIEEFNKKINRGRASSPNNLTIDKFEPHNKNEEEDLTAYNFFYDNNNLLNP